MILTKVQISQLKKEFKKAQLAELRLSRHMQGISALIEEFTGIDGNVDLLAGDGFGFTPMSNNDTHIPIDHLIKHAEKGQDITEDFILCNLSV